MDNTHLTGCGASKDAGFNKMLNPIAINNALKINDLQNTIESCKKYLNIFLLALFVHKCSEQGAFPAQNRTIPDTGCGLQIPAGPSGAAAAQPPHQLRQIQLAAQAAGLRSLQ